MYQIIVPQRGDLTKMILQLEREKIKEEDGIFFPAQPHQQQRFLTATYP